MFKKKIKLVYHMYIRFQTYQKNHLISVEQGETNSFRQGRWRHKSKFLARWLRLLRQSFPSNTDARVRWQRQPCQAERRNGVEVQRWRHDGLRNKQARCFPDNHPAHAFPSQASRSRYDVTVAGRTREADQRELRVWRHIRYSGGDVIRSRGPFEVFLPSLLAKPWFNCWVETF